MKSLKYLALSLLISNTAGPVFATDFADPTWPCVQRKVEKLSLGLMWPVSDTEIAPPSPEAALAIDTLADSLALRRIALPELEPKVAAFVSADEENSALLGTVFETVFSSLSTRRSQIIQGIGEFSQSQIALADKIDGLRAGIAEEMAKPEPDYDKVDALEEQLDWDQVIYSDRQQSITYLCETPVLLEKRLYAVAQMLQNSMD
ncbi:hypothetical protein [Phaeobacter sp. B1627]|uniref:hypothetical protein n=1 Tax=Phaeobacter sp. B1627 TaxID=2583809 RepID=UPI002107AC01|nr:hypothetical protein [Phaeobacter sp. B1627]